MWVTGRCTVTFQVYVVERDALVLSNAAVVFQEGGLDRDSTGAAFSKL